MVAASAFQTHLDVKQVIFAKCGSIVNKLSYDSLNFCTVWHACH